MIFFFPVCYENKTILINITDIPGMEPAFPVNGFFGLFWIFIISFHHMWTTGKDLPVLGNNYFNISQWQTRTPKFEIGFPAYGNDRRRFSEAISFQ